LGAANTNLTVWLSSKTIKETRSYFS